jgi:signal transduction histidine kinase
VALGLETLDVARAHEQALTEMAPGDGARPMPRSALRKARAFFTAVTVPIEQSHRRVQQEESRVTLLTGALHKRTEALSRSTRRLERGTMARRKAEAALSRSAKRHLRLLSDAQELQERARGKTSRQLRNEVAQGLLAIDVRLLALKEAVHSTSDDLKKAITETQQLVEQSVTMIRRLARELEGGHET